jgi:flagellar P-ring protein precursor FlgI
MVTAELPPFGRPGQKVDLTVSSIGDAESLHGGNLLMTTLMGPNQQQVYATGQGAVSLGGFNASQGSNSVRQNHSTVGMVPEGGTIEREINTDFVSRQGVTLLLDNPDFETAQRIANVINQKYGYGSDGYNTAWALDPGKVEVSMPSYFKGQEVAFVAKINKLLIRPDMEAKVVVNERTGTIVMGHNVRISTVAVAHGNLTITISSQQDVSQPPALSEGETETTTDTEIDVSEEGKRLMIVPKGSNISDVVEALNAVGATPRDTISILQAINEAGALHAELKIM